MIKAVIFDLDHTLFDRYATLTEIAKTIRYELPVNPNLTDEDIAEIMRKTHEEFQDMARSKEEIERAAKDLIRGRTDISEQDVDDIISKPCKALSSATCKAPILVVMLVEIE